MTPADDDASTASAFSFWRTLEGSDREGAAADSPPPRTGRPGRSGAPSRERGAPSPRAEAEPPSAAVDAGEESTAGLPAPPDEAQGSSPRRPARAEPPPAITAAAPLRTGSSMLELADDDDDAPLPPAQIAPAHEEAHEEAGDVANRATKNVRPKTLEVIPDDEEGPGDSALQQQIQAGQDGPEDPFDAKARQGGRRQIVTSSSSGNVRQLSTPVPRPASRGISGSGNGNSVNSNGNPSAVVMALDQFPDEPVSPNGDDPLSNSEKSSATSPPQSPSTMPPDLPTELPTEPAAAESSVHSSVLMFHNVEATLVPDEEPEPVIDAIAVPTGSLDDADAIAGRGSLLNPWWSRHKKYIVLTVVLLFLIIVVLVAVMATFLLRQNDENPGGAPVTIVTPSLKPSAALPQDLQDVDDVLGSRSGPPTESPSTRDPTRLPAIDPTLSSQLPTPTTTMIPTSSPTTKKITQSSAVKLVPNEGATSQNSVWINKNVAIHAGTAVVGYPFNDDGRGAAVVFVKDATGDWQQSAKLEAPDSEEDDRFGWSVDIDGEGIAIGAWYDDDRRGSAHVFGRDATGEWAYQAKLLAPERSIDDQFGGNVGIYGDTVVVGAHRDSDGGSSAGAVHVFARDGVVWTHQAKLLAPDASSFDYFGYGVAIHKETIIVGASGDWSGSVYVWVRYGFEWTVQAKLYAPDGTALDYFGRSLDVHEETIVVGAWGDDDNGPTSGSSHVFGRNDNVWTHQAKLVAPDATEYDWFGYSVAIDDNLIIVGVQHDNDGGTNSGSAHVFGRSGPDWTHQTKLVAPDAAAAERFGRAVAIHNGTALVGSHTGNVYVFTS